MVIEPNTVLLGELLAQAALIASTIEYCEILRRREVVRADRRLRDECAESGLQALVRVFVVAPAAPSAAAASGRSLREALAGGEPEPHLLDRLRRAGHARSRSTAAA